MGPAHGWAGTDTRHTLVKEQLHDCVVSVPRGPRQRRPTVRVLRVDVYFPSVEQRLHDCLVPVPRSPRQRRLTVAVLRVNVHLLGVKQQLHDCVVPVSRSPRQRRPTVALRVNVHFPSVEQQPHNCAAPAMRSPCQRRLTVGVLEVDIYLPSVDAVELMPVPTVMSNNVNHTLSYLLRPPACWEAQEPCGGTSCSDKGASILSIRPYYRPRHTQPQLNSHKLYYVRYTL
ncbi:hypothetical protein O988_02801 [Pseudogymnoascus sp. VKM F-3808]|nr:hypothetical protein O988_02801 [Pseudogymnoascus sp. VKM F-3808]